LTNTQLWGIKADEVSFVNPLEAGIELKAPELTGGGWRMQLLIVIAQNEDAELLTQRLSARGLRATKIDTVGGFLARGNVTLLVGVEDDRVEDVFDVIRVTCRTRRHFVNPLLSTADGMSLTVPGPIIPLEVEIGGAVVVSLPVRRLVRTRGAGSRPSPPDDRVLDEARQAAGPPAEGVGHMNLVLSIIRNEDADRVVGGLLTAGHRVTRINTAGMFLRRRNVTLLVGVEEDKVDEVLQIIEANCRRREEASPASEGIPAYSATSFVLDASRLVRI
jgi:uncharacterized protein YaaQ